MGEKVLWSEGEEACRHHTFMILDDILKNKKREIEILKDGKPLGTLKKEVLALPARKAVFLEALISDPSSMAVIAEIKKKSPSKGVLRTDFNPKEIALSYEKAGARALSVLTDRKFFEGSTEILKEVRSVSKLPILRKDFILDEYQIWESRLIGADAVLLIADILTTNDLEKFMRLSESLGLDVLFEVHTKKDAKKALSLKPRLIGINNRDLYTFAVDIKTTANLFGLLPKEPFVVSESGIQNHEDLLYLKRLGVKAVLVGESLMKEKDPGDALKKLINE